MIATAVIAGIAIISVVMGTRKFNTNSQASRHAWRFIDFGAQVSSVVIAAELLRTGGSGPTAIAVLLILVAAGIAYGHYIGSRPSQPYWNYLDGADYALWSAIVLNQVGVLL